MVSGERGRPAGQSHRNLRTPRELESPVTGGNNVVRILTNPRGSWTRYRGSVRLPRLGVGLVATAGLVALGLAAMAPVSAHTTQTTNAAASTGAAYTAMTPVRLLDTRATGQTMGPNSTLNLNVETAADGVPSTATAVALNVTTAATDGGVVTSPGYVSVYPTGGTQPLVSNLNFTAGETVANSVIVPVGTGGSVTFYNHTGNTDLVVDIQGYFAPESAGSTAGAYVPLTPARITDTRTGSGYPNAGSTMGPNSTLNVQVSGAGGVPAGATGAILNVTVTNTTDSGYLEAYPQGATQPTASNLNWTMGETVANRVLVSLSATGMITLYNHTGNTDVIVDVSGYFTNGTSTLPSNASLYSPIAPTRLVDTRVSGGTLSAGGIDTEQIAGLAGIPSTATAGVLNVTAVNTTAASFFTVYPSTGSQPTASDVNWLAGQIVPNLTVATLGTSGAVDVYNHAGSADLVIDAFGYFSPYAAAPIAVSASPTSVPVNAAANDFAAGSQSTITVDISNPSGSTATTDQVQVTETGTACGGFGTTGTWATTGGPTTITYSSGAGSTTFTYNAGITVGTCTITATEANGGNTAATTVTQTAPTNSVTLSGSLSGNKVAAGGAQDTLTATVTANGSASAASDKVTFTTSGTCGTLAPASGTTPATGTESVSTIYTSSSAAGFCTVTATEGNTGQSASLTLDQTTLASGVITVALTPATETLVANGTNSYTVTVTTSSSLGAYGNDQVELMMAPTSDCGTLSSSMVTTNSSGTATVTYTTPVLGATITNNCVISGQEAASGDVSTTANSSTVTQSGPPAATSTISASPSSFSTTAGSGTQTTITTTVDNASGAGAAGVVVTTSESPTASSTSSCGTIGASSTTSSAGTAVFVYSAAPVAGFCTITFTAGTGGPTTTVSVDNLA